jgi:hypothetical protein
MCGGASIALLLQNSMPLRAYAQVPVESRPVGQPTSSQGQQPGSNPTIVLKGPAVPLSPQEQVQMQFLGVGLQLKALQQQVQTLQNQAASDRATIQSLTTSLQNLQAQFANHSHKVSHLVNGSPCGFITTFNLTDAAGNHYNDNPVFVRQACQGHPEWGGTHPNYTEVLQVGTPVQGAQQGTP